MTQTITALTAQKRNPRRVNVYLDGEFAFGLERIVAAWLNVGQQINDEKIAQLQAEDACEVAYQQALRLLNYRPRAEAEVRQNLHKHAISEETIDHVIERLRQSGLLNDTRFAQAWVDNRSEMRPRSQRALAYELRQRGVDQDAIQQALESIDDESLAYQAACKQARKLKDLDWKSFQQKMYRFLSQRGFNYQVVSEVTTRVWTEAHDTDYSPEEGTYL